MKRSSCRVLALGLAISGCASSRVVPRDFERDGLDEVPLRTVAVGALASQAVVLDDARLETFRFFAPPTDEAPLSAGRSIDAQTSREIEAALSRAVAEAGYAVVRARLSTSGESLRDLRARLKTDAVLIVRAVPLERLYILNETASTQILDAAGDGTGIALPQGQGIANLTPGKVFVGQIFLFDRGSGARLWSRQLPGFPTNGTLSRDSELLRFGFVGPEAGKLEKATLSDRAAEAFSRAITAELPAPGQGTEAGATKLASLDVAAETRRERFFDGSHFAVEIGTGWTFERVGGSQRIPNAGEVEELPDLNTGSFAPVGGFQALQARLTFVSPGGLTFTGVGTFGIIPGNGFQRRLFSEGNSPEAGDDVVGTQSIEPGNIFGGGFGFGLLADLETNLFFHPSALLFLEQWSFEVAPAGAFDGDDHVRGGLEVRADLWWTPFDVPLLLRFGLHGRAGIDGAGPPFLGGGGSLGAGVLL